MMRSSLFALLWLLPGLAVSAQEAPRLPDHDRVTPVVQAVRNVGPAVVNIEARARREVEHLHAGLFFPRTRESQSDGSGVLIHPSGIVLTNEHVVHGATEVFVTLMGSKARVPAQIVNVNLNNDLAVLRLDPSKRPYPYAVCGSSADAMVGETTIALGNPFGLESSVTTGILSAKGREVRFRGRSLFKDFLQTSALINPGNSGGPLLDINGRVLGINVAIDRRGPGIGYAIPIDRALEVCETLLHPEIVKDAWIGLDVANRGGALLIERIFENGPADRAGLRVGDRVRTLEGQSVGTPLQLHTALFDCERAHKLRLGITRDGEERVVKVLFEPLQPPLLEDDRRLRALGMIGQETDYALARRYGLRMIDSVTVMSVERDSKAAAILRPGDQIYQVGAFRTPSAEKMARILSYYLRRGAAKIYFLHRGVHYTGVL